MQQQVGESTEFQKRPTGWWCVDDFVLQNPRKVMRDEDCVEPRCERRVDVGARTIADHPSRIGVEAVLFCERSIGCFALFREHFHLGKAVSQSGAIQLVVLLGEVALRDHVEIVALCQLLQRLSDTRKQLDLLLGDRLREANDAAMLLQRDRLCGELFEAGDEGPPKALHAVAVLLDRRAFNAVEVFADLFRRMHPMVEVGDEGGDGSLEVDIVLPQSVVRVEEQGVPGAEGKLRV